VAVVGGGWAGLAAAAELARAGVPVTLFEAARQLGGRARRVDYRGSVLDNGQHIFLGAYRETLRLLELVGAAPDEIERLPLTLSVPGRFHLRAPFLPNPMHLLAALGTARGLSAGERVGAIRFMLALRRGDFRLERDTSVDELLLRHRQEGALRRYLWEPLCLAALNTPTADASAQVFLNVLRDGLSRSRADSDMLLPRTDLGSLFPHRVRAYVEARGGKVELSCPVSAIREARDGWQVEAGGVSRVFDQVVCALPPQRFAALAADLPGLSEQVRLATALGHQPIYTAYIRYPAEVRLPGPILGLAGGLAQWVFDLGRLGRDAGLVAAVISAEGPHQSIRQEELVRRIHAELEDAFGPLPALLWHKVIAEKRATFACTPGLVRPNQLTASEGFYLAGDYTAGDYPATLEGAVQSGVKCAQHILENR
jgi:squalene-associated FAD-dependent desaturase